MKKYLLDTDICIYIIKNKPPKVLAKFKKLHRHNISISAITLAELEYGVFKSTSSEKNQIALAKFLSFIGILPFDTEAAFYYGEIRAHLEKKGNIIGSMDMLIAAHALAKKMTLVTNNTKEFKRVKNLKIENWTK
ncbi:type II toxin-antitoxin system VapC family toxin [Candidatus Peregrinibacteria bacterium]|nr:type II toxin-antitoxin system VapC family toxin [Candidatus Peregrinibacteria bacterium]